MGPGTETSLGHALLSVSDKDGIADFGKALVALGFTILSTGGTASHLVGAGVPVVKVSEHTGAPEIFGGRVKSLHPRIHGGILGDRQAHQDEADANGIEWIDVVAVNLYPFEATVADPRVTLEEAIENIDIGGPAMIRASAKNHRHVIIVVDPADYPRVIAALDAGTIDERLRQELALKAFRHTARYDAVIGDWLGRRLGDQGFPEELGLGLEKMQGLRYGENPHQQGAFYADPDRTGRSLARAVQHQGKELSFNNLADLDGALRTVFEFSEPACAIIKHHNPAGCAAAPGLVLAYERALVGDPVSAYGGVLVFNHPVDGATVQAVRRSKVFYEVIAAPGFSEEALAGLKVRDNLRVLELPADWATTVPPGRDARRVQGGWLLQDWDVGADCGWQVVTTRSPTDDEARALRFAWKVCRNVKSNAIVFALADEDGESVNGVGAGQMSRVDSVKIACRKATRPIPGSVMASDAFFPFADGVEAAIEAGVTAIIQPGGSVRDAEVIAAAEKAGVAMVFTGVRHFRH
jgi:phosphoribosylaminoimidazolecarboxamide formyltransferase/IMP cyclohydrolase